MGISEPEQHMDCKDTSERSIKTVRSVDMFLSDATHVGSSLLSSGHDF